MINKMIKLLYQDLKIVNNQKFKNRVICILLSILSLIVGIATFTCFGAGIMAFIALEFIIFGKLFLLGIMQSIVLYLLMLSIRAITY